MRSTTLALACTLLLLFESASAQVTGDEAVSLTPLTLQEALARAAVASPGLRAKTAQLAAAQGASADAHALLFNNPQLSADQTRRQVPLSGTGGETRREWGAGVSQAFETGGQARFRRETSDAALTALRHEIADTRRQVRSEVTSQFYRVLTLQQRVALETQATKLFDDAAVAVQKRRMAGEDTKLDANVALVEAERARNQLALAREQLIDARAELAARLQLAGPELPQAQGDLAPASNAYRLDDLLDSLAAQPRLLAFAERERSANARLRLENASVYPDVTVGVNVAREGPGTARERLTTVSVSVPLPIFKRNAAGIGQAATAAAQARIEREAALRDARASVQALWFKFASQAQRVRRLQESVVPALTENQTLSVKSRQAGQIGLLELIVVNRQALDAQRDLSDALSDYHTTRSALEFAAGWPREGN